MFIDTSYYIIRGILLITYIAVITIEIYEFIIERQHHVSHTRMHIWLYRIMTGLDMFTYLLYLIGTVQVIIAIGCKKYMYSLVSTPDSNHKEPWALQMEGIMGIVISLGQVLIMGSESIVQYASGVVHASIMILLFLKSVSLLFHTILFFMIDSNSLYIHLVEHITKTISNSPRDLETQSMNIEQYIQNLLIPQKKL